MKTMVVLFMLVLTLVDPLIVDAKESDIGGAAAAAGETTTAADAKKKLDLKGADAKKLQEEFCNTLCLDKNKEPALKSSCLESCAVSQRATLVLIEGVVCLANCAEPAAAATKPACEEACNKEYKAKAAEVATSCDAACSKMECTPPPTPK
jgi:hypothetical protein